MASASPPASPTAGRSPEATSPDQPKYKPLGPWNCWYCQRLNHPVRWFCFHESCGEFRRPPQLKHGAWKCIRNEKCGALNHEIRRRCFKCETERDDPNWAYPPEPWSCEKCNALNHPIRNRCFKESCKADRPLFECLWFCNNCERSNFKNEENCEYCGFRNPDKPVNTPNVVIPDVPLAPTPLTPALTEEEKLHASRFEGDQTPLFFKGDFTVSSHYASTEPLKDFLPRLVDVVPHIQTILDNCVRVCEGKKDGNRAWPPYNLTDDEALALVMYTFDLGLAAKGQQENFYFIVNTVLRERLNETLTRWSPYLYVLQEALKKIPDFSGTVYRGFKDAAFVKEQYQIGRKIHWSAFTSTTPDRTTALTFTGSDGALLEIHVFRGKVIKDFSVFEKENEVLLHPNTKLMVCESKKGEGSDDKLWLVKLVEERDTVIN